MSATPSPASCRCKVKTAIAPAATAGSWRRAHQGGLFGVEAVSQSAPCLGCAVASPAGEGPELHPGQWP
eukprot:2610128-Alexandrium_andersonii.AAC.1